MGIALLIILILILILYFLRFPPVRKLYHGINARVLGINSRLRVRQDANNGSYWSVQTIAITIVIVLALGLVLGLSINGIINRNKEAQSITSKSQEPQKIATNQFTDISEHWATDAILYVITKDLFKGVSDTRFAPNDAMTRAMFTMVLFRYSGDTAYGETGFKDVTDGQWYTESVYGLGKRE